MTGDQMQIASKNWLSPPDPSKNYNIGYKTHQDGTATWFFQGFVFDEWNVKGSLLWIHGKRAFSKLALATILIPSVQRSGCWKEHLTVSLVSLLPFIVIDALH
jgi:hypothetical protein